MNGEGRREGTKQEGKAMPKKKKKSGAKRGRQQKRPLIRLSQCMIVKNEEEHIRQALTWGKQIVWEQIVVDTGSTDRTVELAKKLGATVYSYPWTGDFSAAKNFAIEQAKGNWIAFLDADEWLVPEETKVLMNLLAELHPNRQIDVVRAKIANLNEDGDVINVGSQDRVFRNIPEVRYQNQIHEAVCRIDGRMMQYYDAQEILTIRHSGYAGAERRKKKGERNIRMIEAELQKNPHDGMMWSYLGESCKIYGDEKKAEACYRKVLEDPDMVMTHAAAPLKAGLELMKMMINRPPEEIREDFENIKKRMKELGAEDHPDIDFFMGWLNLRDNDLGWAAEYFERTLQKIESYRGAEGIRATTDLEMMNRIIATMAMIRGNPQKAVSHAVEALKVNRYSTDGLGILLRAFQTEWQGGMPAQPYWQFLSKLYDMHSLKDQLFVYKLSGESGFTALQQEIWNHMPEQVQQRVGLPS